MDVWEIDAWQAEIYGRGGMDSDTAASPIRIAKTLLGEDGVRIVQHGALPSDGQLVRLHGRDLIFLRRGMPRVRVRFLVAHELAELALRGALHPKWPLIPKSIG